MTTRPAYTSAEIRAFLAQARGGREHQRERAVAMTRHPAGSGLTTGAVNLAGHHSIPRDLPHNNEETAR